MLIPLERARALLGREADNLSDEEVSRMGRELEEYARLLVRIDDQRQAVQVNQVELGVA